MRFSFLMSISKIREFSNKSINSILNQNYNQDFELFIISDGLKKQELSYFLEKNFKNNENYKYIKTFSNNKNLGLTKSLNIGLKLCKGDFIIRIDDDDICSNDRLKELSSIIDNNNNIKVITSSYLLINRYDKIKKKIVISRKKFNEKFKYKNILAHSSLCFEKKYILKIGGYNEKFLTSQDFEIINRIVSYKKNNIFISDKFLVLIRIHDKSISKLKSISQRTNSVKICLATKYSEYFDLIVNSDFEFINKIIFKINKNNISEYFDALKYCYFYDKTDRENIKNFIQIKFIAQIYFNNYQLLIKKILFKFFNYKL